MKKITLSLLLCLICLSGMAQSSKKLDLKDITSGKYRAENIRSADARRRALYTNE